MPFTGRMAIGALEKWCCHGPICVGLVLLGMASTQVVLVKLPLPRAICSGGGVTNYFGKPHQANSGAPPTILVPAVDMMSLVLVLVTWVLQGLRDSI